jgi:hypothetical protein
VLISYPETRLERRGKERRPETRERRAENGEMRLSQRELMGDTPALLRKSVERIDWKRVVKLSWCKERKEGAKEGGIRKKQTPSPLWFL